MTPTAEKISTAAQAVLSKWKNSDEKEVSKLVADEANSLDLNSNEIDRLIEQSNTAIMLYLYASTKDKTSEFPIATKDKVQTYLNTDKPEEESYYSKPEEDYTKRDPFDFDSLEEEQEKSAGFLFKKASASVEELEKSIEKTNELCTYLEQRVSNNLLKLASLLRSHKVSFDCLEKNCVGKFGDEVTPIFDTLVKFAEYNSDRYTGTSPKLYTTNIPGFSQIQEIVADLEKIAEAKTLLPQAIETVQERKNILNTIGKRL